MVVSIARWFRAGRITLRSRRITLAGVADQVWCERRGSQASGLYEPLQWPTDEWHVPISSQTPMNSVADLVGEHAPSFMNLQTAIASALGIEESAGGAYSSDFVFRRQDDAARILSVH